MGCVKLLKGIDLTCDNGWKNKYYQNVVLINRADVEGFNIITNNDEHRIKFNLLTGKTGVLFQASELKDLLSASFTKSNSKGIPYYDHKMQIAVVGTNEYVKTLLKQVDNSNYFGAIQFKNGDIEIYGFENGLKSDGYDYQAQGGIGGAPINLSSVISEYEPPYLYKGTGNDTDDFNNLFGNIPSVLNGDFNNDYNDDFFIL